MRSVAAVVMGLCFWLNAMGVEAAVAIRGTATTAGTTNGAALTISKPTGVVDGDVCLAFLYVETTSTISTPTGWSAYTQSQQTRSNPQYRHATYRKRMSSDPVSWQWTWTGSTWGAGTVVCYSGVIASGEPVNQRSITVGSVASQSAVAPAITTTVDGAMLVSAHTIFDCPVGWSPPSGMTQRTVFGAGGCNVGVVFDQAQVSAGSTGTKTAIATVTANEWTAELLALSPEPDVPVVPITFNLGTDTVSWSWSQGAGGPASGFAINCGSAPSTYTIQKGLSGTSTQSTVLSDLISTPGLYYCAIRAQGAGGSSVYSNELYLNAEAASQPAPAAPMRLQGTGRTSGGVRF